MKQHIAGNVLLALFIRMRERGVCSCTHAKGVTVADQLPRVALQTLHWHVHTICQRKFQLPARAESTTESIMITRFL